MKAVASRFILLAGAAEECITPRGPAPLAGYHSVRVSRRVHDDLYCRVCVVRAGAETIAWLGIDLIAVPAGIITAIRTQALKQLGIRRLTCVVGASHTHSAPLVFDLFSDIANRAYISLVVRRAAEAITRAYHNAVPARIGAGSGREATTVFHRRFLMRDGRIKTNPGVGNPDIVRPAGPIDTEVGILKTVDLRGKPLAAVVVFANHADTLGLSEISADWPGVMAAELKRKLGRRFVTVFLNGTSGNINHVNVKGRGPVMGNAVTKRIGLAVANAVHKAWPRIAMDDCARFVTGTCTASMPLKRISPSQLTWARKVLRGVKLPYRVFRELTSFDLAKGGLDVDRLTAQEILAVSRLRMRREPGEILGIATRDTAWIGIPGEVAVEIGFAIKKRSPFRRTYVAGLTNGYMGYMVTDRALQGGGYESMIARTSRLGTGTERVLIDQSLRLLKKLKKL
jgi:hypothetical protein